MIVTNNAIIFFIWEIPYLSSKKPTSVDITTKKTSLGNNTLLKRNIGIKASIYKRPKPLIIGLWYKDVFSLAKQVPKKLFILSSTNFIPKNINNAEKTLV